MPWTGGPAQRDQQCAAGMLGEWSTHHPRIYEDEGLEFIREATLLARPPEANVNERRLNKVEAFDRE